MTLNFVHMEPLHKIRGSCSTALCSQNNFLLILYKKKREPWVGTVLSYCQARTTVLWARKPPHRWERNRGFRVPLPRGDRCRNGREKKEKGIEEDKVAEKENIN